MKKVVMEINMKFYYYIDFNIIGKISIKKYFLKNRKNKIKINTIM